jgi:hypothetical protein
MQVMTHEDANDVTRRGFHKLSLAALSGMLAGTSWGCSGDKPAAPEASAVAQTGKEWHLCRGLNDCKSKGADGKNACAGQGTCASASVHHDCGQQNACKGQGGCGESVGQNECKGQGGCAVPLMDHAWETARKRFEESMDKQGEPVGAAPEAKGN